MGIVDALKSGNVKYTGNASSKVSINVGNGNSNISVRGNDVDITTGTGNQKVVVLGNDVDIKLDQNAPSDWDFSEDNDKVAVISDKGGVNIDTGDGNDLVLAVADDVNINMGDGNHLVGFWGDNVNMDIGNGNNTIYTMDKMISNGLIDENTTFNLGGRDGVFNVGEAAINAIETSTRVETEQLYSISSSSGTNKNSFLNNMKSTYKLDDSNMKMLESLYDSGELFKEYAAGVPKYAIVKSVKQKNSDGSAKYVLARVDGQDKSGYMHTRGLQNGDFKECIATKQRGTTSYTEKETITTQTATREHYVLDGTKNLNIKTGSGTTNDINVTSTGIVNINVGDFESDRINVDAEVRVIGDTNVITDVKTAPARKIALGTNVGATYTSPIIVDFNKDGKVSATDGKGVDVDGNGIADGAATGGDKMLAMSDGNGNGVIDGSEVFGDQTVNPFTGEKVGAPNGFEALKAIAHDAEKYTGVKCMTGDFVNLQSLKEALSVIGVNLGFISDDNITELEDLAHVSALNVNNYKEVDEEGNVQHRQQGSYIDNQGQEYSADDVWFKNRTKLDVMKGSIGD